MQMESGRGREFIPLPVHLPVSTVNVSRQRFGESEELRNIYKPKWKGRFGRVILSVYRGKGNRRGGLSRAVAAKVLTSRDWCSLTNDPPPVVHTIEMDPMRSLKCD
ncbi:hypothetical protein RHMOL_Rhmol11G0146400 [Rhododendron molle]|uniref:Uncharacterized protein n=1 Tax=Rhododendron molle TaxID=49168 RepID=A0ACC0LTA8_RHOML|nr:hypothetical protein RHMOL_Rhmol11G0146400 [Rhododendron molle]